MATQLAEVVNIGLRQRRLRRILGIATIVLGGVIAVLLIAGGASRWWRLVLVIPFATGAITYLEGRRGVCPLTAERGRRDLESLLSMGGDKIEDEDLVAQLRRRGRQMLGDGTLVGLALTAPALVIPA